MTKSAGPAVILPATKEDFPI